MKYGLVSSVLILSLAFTIAVMAQDQAAGAGEGIYKSKCAGCHGPKGEGKMGPALKGTQASEDDIILVLSKGKQGKKAPHAKPMSGLTDEQIKAVAHYIKSLK